jgi:hypothetical protein
VSRTPPRAQAAAVDLSAVEYYEGRAKQAGQRQRGRAAGREPSPAKPLWRGWLHLVWFELSLVLGTVLVIDIPAHERIPATLYTATVSVLVGTSALCRRRPDPSPTVFGFTRFSTPFVRAGATLRYVAIACLIP